MGTLSLCETFVLCLGLLYLDFKGTGSYLYRKDCEYD